MNDPEVTIGMQIVRIGNRKMGNDWLFYEVWKVVRVDPSYGEVIAENVSSGAAVRSRYNDFWSRWEIYKNPNDALKGLI